MTSPGVPGTPPAIVEGPPNLLDLLRAMIDRGASDLHITTGAHPCLRIDDQLQALRRYPQLAADDTERLCYSVLNEEQRERFERSRALDLSFGIKGLARFRANIFMQRGNVAGVFRAIPFKILSLEELGLPPVVGEVSTRPRGLVVVTGPTGSGKTTTLAAIIDKINAETRKHVVTVEDPIEFLHPNKLSIVNQRQIGSDTASYREALTLVLRQDPDVVLVGEMRDAESIQSVLSIAETGHLVFATLHTSSAHHAITRMIDVFPSRQQQQVRVQLSFVLQAVISQLLLPRAGMSGRVAAVEVLLPNPAIRALIREDKVHQIYSLMQVGQTVSGMQTMNQALAAMVLRRQISVDDALGRSSDVAELQQLIEGTVRTPGR